MRDRRLLGRDLPGTQPDATYAYDLSGRMVSAVQDGRTVSFTYDALGRRFACTLDVAATGRVDVARCTRLSGPMDAQAVAAALRNRALYSPSSDTRRLTLNVVL